MTWKGRSSESTERGQGITKYTLIKRSNFSIKAQVDRQHASDVQCELKRGRQVSFPEITR